MGRPKRSSRGGSVGAPASKTRKRTEWSESPFGRSVAAAGLVLSDGAEPNKMTVEPSAFQKKLAISFRRHPNVEEAVEEFCAGLKLYTENAVRFRMALIATNIAEGADVMPRSSGLDSVVRQLLSVDYLQPPVVDLLLTHLTEHMDTAGCGGTLTVGEFHQIPQLILNQLRWLDHIVKGNELCRKLFQVVSVAPVEVQREIVSAIPEVLDDAQHNDAALELKSLLLGNTELTAAAIDALSNLNLTPDVAAEVLDVAMGCLGSSTSTDLPTLLHFIMQQVTVKNGTQIITEVREKLDFDSSFLPIPAAASTPRSSQRLPSRMLSEVSSQFVVFDTIRSSLRFQKPVADGWIKSIEAVSEASEHKVIDLFVLFVLHSLSSRRKAVETLFCAKVRAQLFSEELLAAAFGPHAKALTEFFPSILSLCEGLLASPSPTITTFTSSLYSHLFCTFDVYCQQEVIGTLVTHIGSGLPQEVDHALEIIATLVDVQPAAMDRFAVLINSVLDYLEHLSLGQIRRLYSMLSVLAFHDLEAGSSVQDEMYTLVRKQLSHMEAKYRRMGVIGAVRIIQQLALKRDANNTYLDPSLSQGGSQTSTLPPARRRQAISMIDDVIRSCSHAPDSALLFCDEMSSAVQTSALDPPVLRHISDQTTTAFQDVFLVEVTDPLPTDLGLPLEFAMGLDSPEEGSIAVNLLPLAVTQGGRAGGRGVGLRSLAAQFRLLRTCEYRLNGALEGVDALLGAPVVLCTTDTLKNEVFEELPLATRQGVCLSLCHCLNWFRELVSAFAGEEDTDMRGKVLLRLRNITYLQTQLETCMAATPGFLPPQVKAVEVSPPTRSKRGRGARGDATMANITAASHTADKDSTTTLDKTSATNVVSFDHFRHYFREMDLVVFSILHYSPVSRTLLDTHLHTNEVEELCLLPQQLLLLLQDLSLKLTSSLSPFRSRVSGGKSGRGLKSGCGSSDEVQLYSLEELVVTMVMELPSLCDHLETTCAFFQQQVEENDGVVDMVSSHSDHPLHSANLDLLLRAMATFFSWPPLSDPHYSEQLCKSLRSLASRTGQPAGQLPTTPHHLTQMCHKYLERFAEFLPSLSSALSLVRLMVAICKTSHSDQLHSNIASTCGNLLQRMWSATACSVQQRNEALQYLLRYHIEWAPDSLAVVESVARDAIVELMGEEAREESTTYPTLSSATLSSYYRALISGVVGKVKALPAGTKKHLPTQEELTERFHVLELSAKVFFILVNIVKSFDRRSLLTSALKYGKLYVEAFIRAGMSVLHSLFRSRKDDVIALLKTLQQSTRLLQHFCCHSKVVKDITLTNHVPPCKRSLEALLFRVKELLANYNCVEAFWVGNLKNRDLQGQEILSQISQATPSQEEEREEGEEEPAEEGSSTTTAADHADEIMDSEED